MTSEYIFSIGDNCYFMKNNLIYEGKVVGMIKHPEGFYAYLVEDKSGSRTWFESNFIYFSEYSIFQGLKETMIKYGKEVKE